MNRVFRKGLILLFAGLVIFPAAAGPAPKRVVSTFLCTDEYVFRLVPRENIVALSFEAVDRQPVVSTIADAAAGMRVIRPDTETVLALKPDLVVMYAGVNPRLRSNLERLKIPVLEVPWANTLDDVRAVTRMLGARLGAEAKAETLLTEMDAKLAAARARAPSPAVTTILYQPNGYIGSGAYTGEIMTVAGLRDVAPRALTTPAGMLPVEAVIQTAPELLILGGQAAHGDARAYQILRHPALRALDGKTLRRFADLTPLLCPGPWSADAAPTFGRLARDARQKK